LTVIPDRSLEDCPTVDLLLIPGGAGTDTIMGDPTILTWIREISDTAKLVASVCTGAFVLAAAGLLEGREATTYHGYIERMAREYPGITVLEDRRWVDAGPVVTGAGVSAGIDMALHLLERIFGRDVAAATAADMEYRWEQ
jgi:transcriptional regulator GlxA family with amidase domain